MNESRRDVIAPGQARKVSAQATETADCAEDEAGRLRAARAEAQRMRLSIQRELELVRHIRAEAERYRQEIETKARSQAQMLLLHARLATQKDIAELKRKASEEVEKAVAEIHLIRSTLRKELEAQQKFTNAVRIRAMALTSQEETGESSESDKEAVSV